jgi:hypothetical protein
VAAPENSPRWMDDLARYEAISGAPGMPGPRCRLVPKEGSLVFVATVKAITVSVTGTFEELSPGHSRGFSARHSACSRGPRFGGHIVDIWLGSNALQNGKASRGPPPNHRMQLAAASV